MKVNNHPPPRTHKNTHRHTHSDANRAGGCVTVALEGKVFFMFRVVDVVDLCAGVSACACACVRARACDFTRLIQSLFVRTCVSAGERVGGSVCVWLFASVHLQTCVFGVAI